VSSDGSGARGRDVLIRLELNAGSWIASLVRTEPSSRVGTLCIADHRPPLLDDSDIDEVRHLADQVVVPLPQR